jgi:hypothetical protein
VSGRAATGIAAIASVAAFAAGVFVRMNAAYGPLNLSLDPTDWRLLVDLLRMGQIATRVVLESALLGIAAAAVPWLALLAFRRIRG